MSEVKEGGQRHWGAAAMHKMYLKLLPYMSFTLMLLASGPREESTEEVGQVCEENARVTFPLKEDVMGDWTEVSVYLRRLRWEVAREGVSVTLCRQEKG